MQTAANPPSGIAAAPPASPPSLSLMDLSADDLLERALAGDAMAAFIVTVKSRDSASGITAEDAERVRLGAFEQPLPEPDPKIMAQLEGDQYADIFGTMDSEQRGRYLAENPWVAQRLLELARAGAKRAYFTLRDLAENLLLNPEEMAAFGKLEGDLYADIFGTMDNEQRGRYLADNPWVAQRLLELARAGARSLYFTLRDLAENSLLNPEEMAAFGELDGDQLEGDQYADIFGTMDSEQRGRYLADNPWVAQRLLELARAGAKSAYFTLRDLAENSLLNPEEMAAFGELDESVETPPPAPTAETPPLKVVVKRLLDRHSDRLAVVDRNKLYIRRESGTWIDATRPSPTATGALQGMMKSVGFDPYWGQRQVDVLRSALFILMENPSAYGVSALSSYDFDRAPIFALKQGGSVDARSMEVLNNDATGAHRLLDQSSPGIDYRPALLNAGPDHPGMQLAMHFEPDRANPRFQLLRRIAYLMLGPTKAIDTIVMPETDAGKSTFCAWLQLAFAGYVITADSTNLLSGQGQKFTSVQQRLSKWRLVLLDEADKIQSPVTEGHLNALTADSLTVESKGENSFEMPRRGNVMLVGAAAPNVELGQGGRERLHWAFDGSTVAAMSGELRALIDDPESQAWLATKVIALAARPKISFERRKASHSDLFLE